MAPSFPPTAEQQKAVDAFRSGGNLVLEAGAGTGKTSTLTLLAEAVPSKRMLYAAYNKAIATDAQRRFRPGVICKTSHAFALGRLRTSNDPRVQAVISRLQSPYTSAQNKATIVGLREVFRGGDKDAPRVLQPAQLGRLAFEMVDRWCNSAEPELSAAHLPAVEGLTDAERAELGKVLLPYAQKAWADLTNVDGSARTGHDHYLKLFALTTGAWGVDCVLLDEAQDSAPVVSDMMRTQSIEHGVQVVAVGDRAQQLYGWRGAVDAMDAFDAQHTVALTQSFRFGPAVAAEANKWLGLLGSSMQLTGFTKIGSVVTDQQAARPDVLLSRNNAGVMADLIRFQRAGQRVAVVGGTKAILKLAEAAEALQTTQRTDHPDLCAFTSWEQVRDYADEGSGSELRTLVKLVDSYGTRALIDAANRAVPEDAAQVVVSTAHKAKGREWDVVQVGDDFSGPADDSDGVSADEAMLAYVTVTRAKKVLHRGSLDYVDELVGAQPPTAFPIPTVGDTTAEGRLPLEPAPTPAGLAPAPAEADEVWPGPAPSEVDAPWPGETQETDGLVPVTVALPSTLWERVCTLAGVVGCTPTQMLLRWVEATASTLDQVYDYSTPRNQ